MSETTERATAEAAIIASVEDGKELDRLWFAANPTRTVRLRPPTASELVLFPRDEPLPEGRVWAIRVHQIAPGARQQLTCDISPDLFDADEETILRLLKKPASKLTDPERVAELKAELAAEFGAEANVGAADENAFTPVPGVVPFRNAVLKQRFAWQDDFLSVLGPGAFNSVITAMIDAVKFGRLIDFGKAWPQGIVDQLSTQDKFAERLLHTVPTLHHPFQDAWAGVIRDELNGGLVGLLYVVDTEPYLTAITTDAVSSGPSPGAGGTHASPRAHTRRGHNRRLPDGRVVRVRDCFVNMRSAEELGRLFYTVKG